MSYSGKSEIFKQKSYAANIYFKNSFLGNAPPPPEQIYIITQDGKSVLTQNNFYLVKEE